MGIYFISEDIFTLASYYQPDLRDTGLLPEGWQTLPTDELDEPMFSTLPKPAMLEQAEQVEKTELTNAQKQNRVRQRISQASIDPNKYEYIPAKEQNDHVKADQFQRVAIYARVSTDNPMQTTSFELQQKYYEELVAQHPQWVLMKIYADEGKSGTTMQHRDGFNEMLADADAGKINLIIVKNISRFARNVVDFLSVLRRLAEKNIGVWFESEALYSMKPSSTGTTF